MSTSKALPDERLLMIVAALLRSQGLSQHQIAKRIRWPDGPRTQSTVSRLLARAIEEKILSTTPAFVREQVTDTEIHRAQSRFLEQPDVGGRLKEQTHRRVQQVTVLDEEGDEFVQLAAERVFELLQRSRRIGVMWGRTVSAIVEGIRKKELHSPKNQHEVIPLCGDPLHLINLREVNYSASVLAASLEIGLKGSSESRACLSGVPAYVSKTILEAPAFQSFLNSVPGYKAIFVGKPGSPPLIESVDTVITGVGIVAPESAPPHDTAEFIRERAHQENLTEKELRRLLLGDFGGLLVARHKLPAKDLIRIEQLNEGWIGMTFRQWERIANRAGPAPGIIAIAHGVQKAPMIAAILKKGYINNLIIDRQLFQALQKLL